MRYNMDRVNRESELRGNVMLKLNQKLVAFAVLATVLFAGQTLGQLSHVTVRPLASNVIVPQSRARAFAQQRQGNVEITRLKALVDILESTAVTTIEIQLENKSSQRQEA